MMGDSGEDSIVCPVCRGDIVQHARISGTDVRFWLCPECDSIWPSQEAIRLETGGGLRELLAGHGHPDSYDFVDLIGTGIVELRWSAGSTRVAWPDESSEVVKEYSHPLGSAVLLRDGTGVAVVEPPQSGGGRNAVVFNADGTERFRVVPPDPEQHVRFQRMHYNGLELTAIAITLGGVWAAVVDSNSGLNLRTYETQ